MHVFIALLRGINLGSHNKVPMASLRAALEGVGLENVQTYLQSGNVVFESSKSNPVELAGTISQSIKNTFGHDVPVLVITAAELQGVARHNPFLAKVDDMRTLYVTFLSETPQAELVKAIASDVGGADKWEFMGTTIYLWCPGGYGETKLSNTLFERKLKVTATTRNWNTVQALVKMTE